MRSDDHSVSEADLMAYVDGELDEVQRAIVEVHLARHPEDAATVAALRKQNDAIRALYGPVAAEPVPSRLNLRWITEAHTARPPVMPLAAVLLLCLGLGAAAGWYGRSAFGPPASAASNLVNEAIDAHRLYAREVFHPVEVKANQSAHLSTWLSHRLNRKLSVPDLDSLGFHLVGGRLLPAGDTPAAQFMYEDGQGRRVTLYVIPTSHEPETAFRYVTRSNTEAFYWRDEAIACALVGDLPREDLHRLALQSYRQLG